MIFPTVTVAHMSGETMKVSPTLKPRSNYLKYEQT